MRDGTILANDIWKRFRPDRRRSALREQVSRARDIVAGRTLPWQWALRDVGVHVEPGGSLGLVGNNGSGKSTLLKILAQVMYPYAGRVEVQGRVGALIEVRAGIHVELTGRENVFLYGTLLGLSRRTVADRFDEIVEFAQLDHAIDRQVKFYSSGMQMRLGFAVAAFLEPDILLVDEVLAVGDAAFQQRCLERMRSVLSSGTTLIYVSHDLPTVESICSNALWLDQGVIASEGPVRDVLGSYRASIEAAAEVVSPTDGPVRVVESEVRCPENPVPATQAPLDISVVLEADQGMGCDVFLGVSEGTAHPIFVLKQDVRLEAGVTEVTCTLPRLPLPRGRFFVWLGVLRHDSTDLVSWRPLTHFDVMGPVLYRAPRAVVRTTPIHVEAAWRSKPR